MNKKDKIFTIHDRLLEAILTRDKKGLNEIVHPEVSVFGSAFHEYKRGINNVIPYYTNSLAHLPENLHMDVKKRHYKDLGDQVLVELEFEISSTAQDQNITPLTLRQSAIWTRERDDGNEKWLLLHDHTSMPDQPASSEEVSAGGLPDENLNTKIDYQNLQARLNDASKEVIKLRKQLLKQEKLAAVGQLAAGIAHEIKNPLNFVNNFSEVSLEMVEEIRSDILSRESKEKSERGKQGDGAFSEKEGTDAILDTLDDIEANIRKIHEHGKRANSIVKSMLLHSRGKSGSPVLTDLNTLLDEHLKLAYHGMRATNSSFNVEINTDYDRQLPKIKLIPQDMSRAFLNILNNAMYAAYEHSINRGDGGAKLEIQTVLYNKHAVITIRDNGSGIPDKIREQIFEPFFTTKPAGAGTGLGLSMTSDIVKMHKGTIEVESENNQFTEFKITIPID